tara:strand:- start:1449 stop:2030 length:582 start_codon:yes stop_codon:yes gene_type:complete
MANAKKACRYCKEYKQVHTMVKVPLGVFCAWGCAVAHGKALAEKKKLKAIKVKHKADKERVKTKAKWLSDLQVIVNLYVRLRDKFEPCASCDKGPEWGGQWQAGHYYSRGHSSSLRFNLNNIHKQCSVCNNHLSGNIGQYTPKLINKIGKVKFDYLTAHKSDIRSYDVEWIKRAIKIARKGVKRIKSINVKYN